MPASRVFQLGPADDLPGSDHVLVVKLMPGCFEVSGTAGLPPKATYLPATSFENQWDAFAVAHEFAGKHSINSIFVKGFTPRRG